MGIPEEGEDGGASRKAAGQGEQATVLFLDDSAWRHAEFDRVTEGLGVSVVHAWSAREAISLLEERRFVQAFLDHDLSEEDVMCAPGGATRVPTGMDVVDHISRMDGPPTAIVVHSCNGPAATEMEARLLRHPARPFVTRVPFPSLVSQLAGKRR